MLLGTLMLHLFVLHYLSKSRLLFDALHGPEATWPLLSQSVSELQCRL
jgi:hypothetical protein